MLFTDGRVKRQCQVCGSPYRPHVADQRFCGGYCRAEARRREAKSARRVWISNSASPPRTVIISLPCGVVVSAQGSPRDLKLAPRSATAARVLSKSLVLRASRSSFVTSNTSPASSPRKQRANAARSVLTPDCFSAYTRSAPAAVRAVCWASSDWPSVLTRA